MRATEAEIQAAITKANLAVLEAEAERDHWRRAAGQMQAEIRVLVGVWMARTHAKRILITEAEAALLKRSDKLYVGNPDAGTRLYELREGKEAPMPESKFIGPNGSNP